MLLPPGFVARNRADVHDPSTALLPHDRRDRPRHQEWSTRIRVQNGLPDIGRERFHIREGNPTVVRGVANEHVNPSKRCADVCDEHLDRSSVRDIGLEGARVGRACLAQLAHQTRGSFVARVIDHRQSGVLSREGVADATAKSPCSASDQHHCICELHVATVAWRV